MKKFIGLCALIGICSGLCAQNIGDLYKRLQDEKIEKNKFYILSEIGKYYYEKGFPDSVLSYSESALKLAQRLKNDSFLVSSYKSQGNFAYLKNDHVTAIEYYFQGIIIAEKENLANLLLSLYNNIGWNYFKLGYYSKAFDYFKKAIPLLTTEDSIQPDPYIYENLAETYLMLHNVDSAEIYVKLADNMNKAYKDDYIQAAIYITYGNVFELTQPEFAQNYFRKAISFSNQKQDYKHLANSTYEYAHFLFEQKNYDSARFYASQSLSLSLKYGYKDNIVTNAEILRKIYDRQSLIEKAYYYSGLKNKYNDTLNDVQVRNQMIAMTFNETLRENEEKLKKEEAAHERKLNVQYFMIAIGLVSLVIAFLLLSQSIYVNPKTIIFLGTIGLLIFFEFINLFIHPYIEKVTDHSPLLMLAILAIIASILIPFHHKLEKYVRTQLVEKNKRIRLLNAEKIIAESND